ncbi:MULTISPECIES: type-F conjugative transfer system protein TraW [Vibrio]|uniref:Type-F conjugative transfer system protein TraW n=1 Tax=Vibrio parahaemolyticus TaxID=670 RepID=A0AA47LAQ9_VIBPH|nr:MULTISPECIES: type-F conjugative transfer system protein TraW [Vibrio]MBE3780033.1 type-F conjugative transfer system protein TraW [Vibrio parahaemolyticus]MBE4231415.1 type-F conjugative transfer system protein TraW [Vibrio parahaemolyticus]MCZ6249619.1 type-F conjugative transfer system protein TraW [Vibrio parahaemolyticus]MCZ6279362.1 type-F conjugative transfer system protein TraW [Vibrio parahaemolyticus]MCZ6417383.1 type-F conjugative transfer system protein TraW [Vibrio parahaemolyt
MPPNRQLFALTLVISLLASPLAIGKNFGRQGEVFPIAEVDMLEWIDARLKHLEATGQTAQMQQDFIEQVESRVRRPSPVEGLTTTTTPRTFYIDPSLKLATDIKDAQGNLIYAKGLIINPFDTDTWPIEIPKTQFEYQHTLIFFDGDDVRQRTWAKQYQSEKPIKWILTNGSPDELALTLDARIYFDQQGNYSRQFQLAHTPSIIEQDGKRWKVTEIDVTPFTNALMERKIE